MNTVGHNRGRLRRCNEAEYQSLQRLLDDHPANTDGEMNQSPALAHHQVANPVMQFTVRNHVHNIA